MNLLYFHFLLCLHLCYSEFRKDNFFVFSEVYCIQTQHNCRIETNCLNGRQFNCFGPQMTFSRRVVKMQNSNLRRAVRKQNSNSRRAVQNPKFQFDARYSKMRQISQSHLLVKMCNILMHDQSCTEIPKGNPYGITYILTYYV